MLPELGEAGLDESSFRFVYGDFANPSGANARNEVLHGFVDDPAEVATVLVLLAAL